MVQGYADSIPLTTSGNLFRGERGGIATGGWRRVRGEIRENCTTLTGAENISIQMVQPELSDRNIVIYHVCQGSGCRKDKKENDKFIIRFTTVSRSLNLL